ncbi:hypothetical protein C4585_02930 [Candidatus Parcubacteria bacterium]|nr:MAG: hypothetical protein C4585_02930 [Candidatus Parcubacteria bacterium]
MLSFFPELLFLSPFSAFLIRIALGCVFGYVAWKHFEKPDLSIRAYSVLEGALALTLIFGAWVQLGALVSILIIGSWFFFRKLRVVALGTALLSIALSITLLVTGAGPFAFDLPL